MLLLAPEKLIGHICKVPSSLDAIDVEKGHIATGLTDSCQPQHAPDIQIVVTHCSVVANVFVAVGQHGLVENIVAYGILTA